MPSNYWIKVYHEVLHDPKMGRLSDRLWRRCIELMLLAGENGDDGTLPPLEDIAWALRIDVNELDADLRALSEWDFIHCDDRCIWIVTNFKKRQEAATSTQRSDYFRKRQVQAALKDTTSWQVDLWRPLPATPGVYCIRCEGTGKVYIGGTVNLQQRVRQHLTLISTGQHQMAADVKRHGVETVSVEVLEHIRDARELRDREAHYFAQYTNDDLYNVDATSKRHRDWNEQRNGNESLQSRDVDTDTDTDTESDTESSSIAADAATPPPKPKEQEQRYTPLQRHFLALWRAKRLNSSQCEAIDDYESQYGYERVVETSKWAHREEMTMGHAINSLRTALKNWDKPKPSRRNNGREPPPSKHQIPTLEEANAFRASQGQPPLTQTELEVLYGIHSQSP